MSLTEYRCQDCGKTQYVFAGEERRLGPESCRYEALPPWVTVVHTTEIFMLSQIDSIHTIDELDKQATREAEDDREDKAYQAARRDL